MASRFYLPSTGAAAVSPANDAWDKTTGAGAARAAVRTRISSAMATVTNTHPATTLTDALIRQYVTEQLNAQTISGTVSGAMRCIESNGALSACVAVSIRACSGDGGTIRSPALLAITNSDLYTSTTVHEMATTLTNRLLEDVNENTSIALTSCTIQAGDRLVIEFGYKASGTSGTQTGGISFGDNSGTDLSATDTTVTTANNPWIEFSQTLDFNRTIALTGEQAASAVEALTASAEKALTGEQAAGSVNSLAKSISAALTDNLATGEVESISLELSRAISGEVAAGATGDVHQATAITGVQATGEVGSVVVFTNDVTLPITGIEATTEVGDLASKLDAAVAGILATSSVETVAAGLGRPLAGSGSISAIGDVGADSKIGLSGAVVAGSVETVAAFISTSPSGVAADSAVNSIGVSIAHSILGEETAGDVGILSPAMQLEGLEAAGEVDSVSVSSEVGLSGVSATSALGDVIAIAGQFVPIAGVEGGGFVGDVAPSADVALEGAEAVGVADAPSPSLEVAAEGIEATSAVGNAVYIEAVFDPDNTNIWYEAGRETQWIEGGRATEWREAARERGWSSKR